MLVRYYGKITDQYGNSTDDMLISYTMDLPLYKKISWSGFSSTQNDSHLCAFLREEENNLDANNVDKMYIGCVVFPSNLHTAENKIEASNPQYKDIPQY